MNDVSTQTVAAAVSMGSIVPAPASVNPTGGTFHLTDGAAITVQPGSAEIKQIGTYLAGKLSPATGYTLPVQTADNAASNTGSILLTTVGGDPALGEEGYLLTVTDKNVTLTAYKPAGLFRGIQTIRQMLPAAIDSKSVQSVDWTLATGTIRDYPRFDWRGAMLDVSRHFFPVDVVKQYIDLLAYYKINHFHLHLSDDQGWRIAINSWPKLTTYGGSTEVGGGAGGYYTQAQYSDLVAYAQSRYITLVPEIDMPGHTNAALASYPQLNCNGTAPSLYTGTNVGFSSLCTSQEATYTFIDEVIGELAALTPGPYIHIGGDESSATAPADYVAFINRVQKIVAAHGKQIIGWEEIGQTTLLPNTIVQFWNNNASGNDLLNRAISQGAKAVMSPANRAYLDMKYDSSTALGLDWAGTVSVQAAYQWDPATLVSGVSDSDILGVEAPLWSETLITLPDIEFMAFPRIIGDAEIGWSQAAGRTWDDYKLRLAAQGARLTALGVNFYHAPEVPWS